MSSVVPTKSLVTLRRFDIAVKFRFFSHLCMGDDPDSERVYRWHIAARRNANAEINLGTDGEKDGIDDYVKTCKSLLVSISTKGFDPVYAVPIVPDGELLSGAHRLACALALGFGDIPVRRIAKTVWAPAWGRQWFIDNGVDLKDLARIEADWKALGGQA